MKIILRISVLVILLIFSRSLNAQDPSFSQFFSSPLNVNPALTANINSDWRLISNFRDQWIGPASPYVTGTISYDSKIFQNKVPNVETEGNIMGIGGMLMFDHAMSGVVKSTYASLNLSYSIKISETENYSERIGVGFGAIYGSRNIDFSRVNFEEQFTGFGFNTNLPTGETALSNMKPYFSASTGIVYSAKTLKSNCRFRCSRVSFKQAKANIPGRQTTSFWPSVKLHMQILKHLLRSGQCLTLTQFTSSNKKRIIFP